MLVELVRESKVELGAEGTFVLAKRVLPAGHPPGQRGVFDLFRMDKIWKGRCRTLNGVGGNGR